MPKSEILVGLDIGTTKICTIVGEVQGEKVDVIGVGLSPCAGLKKGIVVDLEATTKAIEDSVQKAQRMAGVEINSVIVGITGEHINSQNGRGVVAITRSNREITEEDVERVLDAAKIVIYPPERELIHNIARGYSIDGQEGIKDPVGMSGTRLEVETHIVTGASTFIQNVTKCVQRAGLSVEQIVLEPIATAESVLEPDEKELGVALLDIGGGTSDLAIFSNGSIAYSAVIPVGGNHVTQDIAYGLQISLDEAEKLKLAKGGAVESAIPEDETFTVRGLGDNEEHTLPRRVLGHIIEPRIEELLQIVRQEIDKSGFADMLPLGVVLSGGGSLVPGMVDMAKRVFGSRVRIGGPRGFGGLVDDVSTPVYATGVGLVQYGAVHEFSGHPDKGLGGVPGSILRRIGRGILRLFGL